MDGVTAEDLRREAIRCYYQGEESLGDIALGLLAHHLEESAAALIVDAQDRNDRILIADFLLHVLADKAPGSVAP